MVRGERDIKPKAPGVSLHALGLAPGSTGMGSALPGACPGQYPLAAILDSCSPALSRACPAFGHTVHISPAARINTQLCVNT